MFSELIYTLCVITPHGDAVARADVLDAAEEDIFTLDCTDEGDEVAGLSLILYYRISGESPDDVLVELLKNDSGRERRQVGVVNAKGESASFTGKRCNNWAGGISEKNFCVQGNILTGEEVVKEMARGFKEAKGDLGERMIAALMAGQKAGGDSRGKQSAALYIAREKGGYSEFNDRYRDLRVDDHKEPIKELLRIYRLHKRIFPPPKKK